MPVRAHNPLVLVLALGIFGVEPLELLRQARAELPKLPIFLLGDRDGELPDEDAAARVGATRLFLRPIDINALADAIEKRAVEAEVAEDVAEAMAEFDVRPPTIDAEPLVEEAIVEMEADYGGDDEEAPARALAKIALKRDADRGDEGRHRGARVGAARRGERRQGRGDARDGRRRADAGAACGSRGDTRRAADRVDAAGDGRRRAAHARRRRAHRRRAAAAGGRARLRGQARRRRAAAAGAHPGAGQARRACRARQARVRRALDVLATPRERAVGRRAPAVSRFTVDDQRDAATNTKTRSATSTSTRSASTRSPASAPTRSTPRSI